MNRWNGHSSNISIEEARNETDDPSGDDTEAGIRRQKDAFHNRPPGDYGRRGTMPGGSRSGRR